MKLFTDYLDYLNTIRFWGDINLRFQDGEIVVIEQNQKIKPKELSNSMGRENHLELHDSTEGRHVPKWKLTQEV